MRLFLAVDPDGQARTAIEAVRASFERVAGGDAANLRWVDAAAAHITLHFLGQVDAASLDRLIAALGARLPGAPFEAILTAPELFPAAGPPRVVWMPVSRGNRELLDLHDELGVRLEQAGVPVERREFTPHLTLARVRDRRRARSLSGRVRDVRAPAIQWRVDRVTLFESDLSGRAPRYHARHVIGIGSAS